MTAGAIREHPQRRDHRARRPWQDHAGRQPPQAVGQLPRRRTREARGRAARPHHGLQPARARARHHHPLEELRRHVPRARRQGLPHQHHRHARPRRLRRRGRARAPHGRRRLLLVDSLRRPDAPDQVRAGQGAGSWASSRSSSSTRSIARTARPRRSSTRSSTSSSSLAPTITRWTSRRLRRRVATAGPSDVADPRAKERPKDVRDVFEAIIKQVPAPPRTIRSAAAGLITTLDYNDYVGRIGIGRVFAGKLKSRAAGRRAQARRQARQPRPSKLLQFSGPQARPTPRNPSTRATCAPSWASRASTSATRSPTPSNAKSPSRR
jgi:hypothetical protein